jgi:tRNA (guanine10-N2)-dimethyltransferase
MFSYSHIALLGRQPELGLVELESILGAGGVEPFGNRTALMASNPNLDVLGGAQKIGRVIYQGPTIALIEALDIKVLPVYEKKTPIAVSYYGLRATTRFVLSSGLELKNRLRHEGRSIRLITPAKGTDVTVAQLKHNRVLEDGFELMVVVNKQEMIVALTEQIQNIDWYSKRDYDRPARSAKVGMLPPKLAQILINTTSGKLVVDPFCGTGVIPQEALLVGRKALGSDMSPEMISASAQNLTWLQEQRPDITGNWRLLPPIDARQLKLPEADCSVVSEGYLGPNMIHEPTGPQLSSIKAELRELYLGALGSWAPQQVSGAEVALCVPAWRQGKNWSYLDILDSLPGLSYTMKVFKHSSEPLLYARDDQIVGRQLLLLRKN